MNSDSAITLHLFGPFGVSDPQGRNLEGLSRRGQALLAYLSQQRGMQAERGRLADLLWSDRSEEQSRASLRQELSTLRKLLPPGLLDANRQSVWLDGERVKLDQSGQGSFMDGFDLASEGFEDWLRERRMTVATSNDNDGDAPAVSPPDIFTRPAVLLFAFEALSADENDALIAASLIDDLKITLSYWRWFPVIGPEAIGWKTAKDGDMRSIAALVNARYAITGTLRCLGNRIRISVSLTETETGRLRWSEQFDGTLDDIFEFQEDVSRAIVAQLEPQLARAEAVRIERSHPASVGPWQLVAQAEEIDRKGGEGYGTPESNLEQMHLMESALALDPCFAPAHARIGRIYFRAGLLDWYEDRLVCFHKALAATNRALEIDPENWEAHAYNGLTNIFGLQEYSKGLHHANESVRLNPSAALARHALGCGLEWLGRPQEALEHLNLIFRLNPNHPNRAAALGDITTCELFLGNRDRAIDAAKRLFDIAPGYARGLQRCVVTFGYFDETDLAARSLDLLREAQPGFDEAYMRETYPYVRPEHVEMVLEGMRKAGAFDP
jgi:TolB-like protein